MLLTEIRQALNENLGEYWIQDGTAVGADGDVNDANHEAVVLQSVMFDMADIFGAQLGEFDDESDMYEKIHDALDLTPEEEQEWEDGNWQDIMTEKVPPGTDMEKFKAMFMVLNGNTDARDFGKRYYGWIRLKNFDVDMWALTSDSMRSLAGGIDDILGGGDEYADYKFNIEVAYPRHQFFTEVPLDVIESGRIAKLIHYKER